MTSGMVLPQAVEPSESSVGFTGYFTKRKRTQLGHC